VIATVLDTPTVIDQKKNDSRTRRSEGDLFDIYVEPLAKPRGEFPATEGRVWRVWYQWAGRKYMKHLPSEATALYYQNEAVELDGFYDAEHPY
jgi:hypothetical protein